MNLLPLPPEWLCTGLGTGTVVLGALLALYAARPERRVIVRLGGLTWTRAEFCRGWLVTGDTGSGKTSSGINQLCHQLFRHVPDWGGLCIDEKGVYWETLQRMACHYGREKDLIQLQVRPDDAGADWAPRQRFNLTPCLETLSASADRPSRRHSG